MENQISFIIAIVLSVLAFFFAILFSLAEHSFSKLKASDVKWMVRKQDIKSKQLLKLLESGLALVSGMELWKLFSILTLVFASNIALLELTKNYFAGEYLLLVNISLIFVLILVFVFLVPKIYAENHVLVVARYVTSKVAPFYNLTYPIISWWTNLQQKYQTDASANENNELTIKKSIIKQSSSNSTTEYHILKKIQAFPTKLVKHVIKPRVEMVALDSEMDFLEVIKVVATNRRSRLPVYENEKDNIIGILYTKDLMPYYDRVDFYWKSLMKVPMYINSDLQLIDLLDKFNTKRKHMAIVLDEFGGCLGLVTMEDVIEVITGQIEDEFDDHFDYIQKKSDNTFLINPKINIDNLLAYDERFETIFKDINQYNVETLNGYLLEKFKSLPQKNDTLSLQGATLKVEKVAANIIQEVQLNIS